MTRNPSEDLISCNKERVGLEKEKGKREARAGSFRLLIIHMAQRNGPAAGRPGCYL